MYGRPEEYADLQLDGDQLLYLFDLVKNRGPGI